MMKNDKFGMKFGYDRIAPEEVQAGDHVRFSDTGMLVLKVEGDKVTVRDFGFGDSTWTLAQMKERKMKFYRKSKQA